MIKFKCNYCGKEYRASYHITNNKKHVCNLCSWWWPVDKVNNCLIDPSTISVTWDTLVKLVRYFGYSMD